VAIRNEEAAKMNAFFTGSDCEDDASLLKCLDASLEQFQRLYGHTPRHVARALEESLRPWQPPCPWPVPVSHARHEEADLTPEQHEMARHAFSAYMTLLGTKWNNSAHLGFKAEDFGVSRETLEARIEQGYTTANVPAQAAGGSQLCVPRIDASGGINVMLVRIQVKMATQATLRQQDTAAGDKEVKKALKKLSDPDTAPLQMDRACAAVWHFSCPGAWLRRSASCAA